MFHILSDAKLASYRIFTAGSGLIEPVFAGYVVAYKLIGKES